MSKLFDWLKGHPKEEPLREAVIPAAETGRRDTISEEPKPCAHPAALVKEIAGTGTRCGQCGEVLQPHQGPPRNGVRREELSSYAGTKANFAPKGFSIARARFFGGGRAQ